MITLKRVFYKSVMLESQQTWIDGAIEVLSSSVARMFVPPQGACYECTMSEVDYKLINRRKSCMLLGTDEIASGKFPLHRPIASVIAGVQVQETVKYLHKRDDLLLLEKGKDLF